MSDQKKLKFLKSINGLDYYLFYPSLGKWFFKNWDGYKEDIEKHSKKQKMRMFLEWIWGGYSVYYISLNDELVGYVLIASGGRRITCSTRKDIVLGPYYILKEKRGLGLMSKALTAVLHDLDLLYENAYCYIKKDNVASLRTAIKSGFEIVGQAEMRGKLRKLFLTDNKNSNFYIVKYKK